MTLENLINKYSEHYALVFLITMCVVDLIMGFGLDKCFLVYFIHSGRIQIGVHHVMFFS